jgi:hypothetical protein
MLWSQVSAIFCKFLGEKIGFFAKTNVNSKVVGLAPVHWECQIKQKSAPGCVCDKADQWLFCPKTKAKSTCEPSLSHVKVFVQLKPLLRN